MVTTRKTGPKAPARNRSATPEAAAKPTVKKTTHKAVKTATAPKTVVTKVLQTPAPKAEKKSKPEKIKVVRDSFTIPKTEYAAIANIKKRAMAAGKEVKKSELLRAGLMLLATSSDAAFAKALAQVPALKTGRPGKG